MHSIFVHLVDVSREEIGSYLDARTERGLREHWYSPNRSDPNFSIRFPHGNSEFRDAQNREHVVQALGREPDVTVQFDSGARHPGHKPLRLFLAKLLAEYTGVALDDLSPHVWTVDELEADAHVNGFAFADHESWRKLHHVNTAAPHKTAHGDPHGGASRASPR